MLVNQKEVMEVVGKVTKKAEALYGYDAIHCDCIEKGNVIRQYQIGFDATVEHNLPLLYVSLIMDKEGNITTVLWSSDTPKAFIHHDGFNNEYYHKEVKSYNEATSLIEGLLVNATEHHRTL